MKKRKSSVTPENTEIAWPEIDDHGRPIEKKEPPRKEKPKKVERSQAY